MFRHSRHTFLDNCAGTRLDDSGVATPEAATLMTVFALFAATLWVLLQGDAVKQGIADLVDRALSLAG